MRRLSFLTKLSSGYWNVFDPTNGYMAADARRWPCSSGTNSTDGIFSRPIFCFASAFCAQSHGLSDDLDLRDQKSNLRIHREGRAIFLSQASVTRQAFFLQLFLRDSTSPSLEILWGTILVLFG